MYPPKPIDAYSRFRRRTNINFTIQLMQEPTAPSKEFLEDLQQKLLTAVDHVHAQKVFTMSKQKLYECCKTACRNGLLRPLWAAIIRKREEVISSRIGAIAQKVAESSYVLCQALHRLWLTTCHENVDFQEVFCWLDRTLVTSRKYKDNWDPKFAGFFDLSKKLLQQHLRKNMDIIHSMLMGLVGLLEVGRGSESQSSDDITLIKDLIWMLIKLGMYDCFEKVHIFALRGFYEREASTVINTMDANGYLQHVSDRIDEEINRTKDLTEKRSLRLVKSTMEEVMIKQHIQTILQRGFITEIEKRNLESLKLMYQMLGRVACLNELKSVFGQYMCDVGSRIVGSDNKNEEVNKEMIPQCIVFWTELHNIVNYCFDSNSDFKEELSKTWKTFMNRRRSRITIILLTKFLDEHLSGSAVSNQVPDEEVEKVLGQAMSLLCMIEDEGLFQVRYRKDLARRLLEGTAKRIQCEIFMIGRIKAECGQTVAMLLEGMLKDVDISKQLAGDYNEELLKLAGSRTPPANLLTPFVLTTIMWPIVPDRNSIALPSNIVHLQKSFEKFYSRRFKGRRLKWHVSRTTAIVEGRFGKGFKELQVTAYQALILLLFCKRPLWLIWEIKNAICLPMEELKQSLAPLYSDKILLKSPQSVEIRDDDWFKVNEDFTSEHFRVKVSKVDDTEKEDQEVSKVIGKDQESQMDATIVRLMKVHKQLRHSQLIQETTKLLKFSPSIVRLNERIERLIHRDYIKKDETDPQIYYYQA